MDDVRFDRSAVAAAFDAYGEREWARHDQSAWERVAFHVHRSLLERHVVSGDRVLEIGAGPGRFTVELARLGAKISVLDVSEGQLRLNEQHVREAGMERSVEGRHVGDVAQLTGIVDESFDRVVCYGVLSFVLDRADDGLAEMLRVTREGGTVLVSVASRYGTMRAFLGRVFEEIGPHGIHWSERVVATGDLLSPHSSVGLPMHLYTWDEMNSLFERHGCEVLDASASNFLTTAADDAVRSFADDPGLWDRFLHWELAACAQPGALDGGTQIVAAVRRR